MMCYYSNAHFQGQRVNFATDSSISYYKLWHKYVECRQLFRASRLTDRQTSGHQKWLVTISLRTHLTIPFHSNFRALSARYVVFRLMVRVRAEQHIVMTGHSARPTGLVIDLLISVILYWYIGLLIIAHNWLESDVHTLSAGHSDHNFLFQLHSATLQDAALLQTNRTLVDNGGGVPLLRTLKTT